jgi:hypothetical protein
MNSTASATAQRSPPPASSRPHLDGKLNPLTVVLFMGMLAFGLLFTAYSLFNDVKDAGQVPVTTYVPYILLGVALLIALAFEFVNGFHDTANAVAIVIYTHSLQPSFAVRVVGNLQLPRRARVERCSGVRHHLAAAGGADPAGRIERGLCHGVRVIDRRNHLESRHLVARAAGLVIAHLDRLDPRRRHRQRAHAWTRRHQRCGLGAGNQSRLFAAVVPVDRVRLCGAAAGRFARVREESGAL